jgi:hypothetical protein
VSVFCDLIGKRVLFATSGEDAATWGAFDTAFEEHNGQPRQSGRDTHKVRPDSGPPPRVPGLDGLLTGRVRDYLPNAGTLAPPTRLPESSIPVLAPWSCKKSAVGSQSMEFTTDAPRTS